MCAKLQRVRALRRAGFVTRYGELPQQFGPEHELAPDQDPQAREAFGVCVGMPCHRSLP